MPCLGNLICKSIVNFMDKNEILLSIIIPVYNVEKFIKVCLDSILSYESTLYETIIVNDGTQDNSMSIVEQYVKQNDNRIIIINQENQGLSNTRNNGIRKAKGKYIWFIDSDDFIEINAIDSILKEIKKKEPDVFAMPIIYNYSNGERIADVVFRNETITNEDYLNRKYPFGASVRFLLKRDFLLKNNLFFIPNILHEDGEFGLRMLYYAKEIAIISKTFYNYRIQECGSIMSSWSEKNSIDLIYISKLLNQLFRSNPLKINNKVFINSIFSILLSSVQFAKNKWNTTQFDVFYKKNKSKIRHEAFQVLVGSSIVVKIKLLLFIISPFYYVKYRSRIGRLLVSVQK